MSFFDYQKKSRQAGGQFIPAFEPTAATEATQVRPGSPEKVRIIQERLSRGEDIWHQEDARLDYQPTVNPFAEMRDMLRQL